ncbi:glycosyltransferase [Pradoshia sp. D12]|uniref:glycosyltransferase family 4 protein n=1 Tax=Bacillaceae TaxID=186817 RepID=UPI0011268D73|nr:MULTISPECIES: glycosyltransferase family 4 protein [Bacillaceae]QFK72926.1 glycosyltransferase [Pradoshia sp. D12]TPF71918.1 glycosyltransferase [Bacillus sp. D12]
MRVLQINSVYGVGSTGRIATDIDKILKKLGHESYIAFGRGQVNECDTVIKVGNNFDNYMHVAKTRLLDRHGFSSTYATKKFIKELEDLNPDIIHLHNLHGYYLNIEILFDYLKIADKPVVWTLHDCWAFTGHCAYFDYINCDKWVNECNNCPQKNSYPASIFMDSSKENYNDKKNIFCGVRNMTIVTPSKWLAGLVKKSFLKEYPVEVINNGIDLNTFKHTNSTFREKYNLNNKFIILGVSSGWEKRKGLQYFIDLSKKVNSDNIIVLVGLSEAQLKNLPSNIVGITRTNSTKELAEIYSTADVFVNPTLEDNFPTTNLESLACGTPVITFDTGGSVESVNSDCGLIIPKGNLKCLLNGINEIQSKGKGEYSRQCIYQAMECFDKNKKFIEYIELYERLSKS